jgi:hypothetical protein
MKKILDHDSETGITEVFHGSADGETYTIETIQDISPLLDANKAQQNEGFNKRSDMWHAASIPAVVQLEWLTKFGVDMHDKNHWPAVKRLLNSSDYAHLRRSNFTL